MFLNAQKDGAAVQQTNLSKMRLITGKMVMIGLSIPQKSSARTTVVDKEVNHSLREGMRQMALNERVLSQLDFVQNLKEADG